LSSTELLIDSHCHLNYLDNPASALAAARANGVGACVCIGVDEKGWPEVAAIADSNTDVFASAGIHPDAAVPVAQALHWLPRALSHSRVVAVGETGLDYSRQPNAAVMQTQRECFTWQLELAREHGLPVVVHTRGARDDTLAIIRAAPGVIGVLHCFTESWEMAAAALELGYYISMSGIVTFKNASQVQDVARRVPADRLLVETDAPWLAPVPHRGKQNQPAFVVDTAAFVAQLRGCTASELTAQTRANTLRLFSRMQLNQTKKPV